MISPDQIDVKQEYIDDYVNTYRGHGSGSLNIPGDGIASLLARIANNPIEPTKEDVKALENAWQLSVGVPSARFFAVEWQRRMFLKREPEMPKKVKALLTNLESVQGWDANQRIRDAYELGLKNGGSK